MKISAEQNIIKIIKLVPLLAILLSALSIILIKNGTQRSFELELESFKQDAEVDKKLEIQSEVYRVYQFIESERALTTARIKRNLSARTQEALAIAQSIYERNKGKPKAEVIAIIKSALMDIRFNNGRGYFFIYDSAGTSVMHPILNEIQGQNLWDFQDTKGTYVIRELSNIVKDHGRGFFTWWWTKPEDQNKEYKKIGFVEKFEPYDWFIGTGEYVLDYEETLKNRLLEHIDKIRFGKNGYIFILNTDGVYLSHYKKAYVGTNRLFLKDSQGVEITKEIIKRAQGEEGYLSYIASISPETDLPAKKIAFIKGYKDWQWAIGTGVYLSDINRTINSKKARLDKQRDAELIQLLFIGAIIFVSFFLVSWIFANQIRRRFEKYKYNVDVKSQELSTLNKHLEQKVKERTVKLEQSLTELTLAQSKLVESEKMAGLHSVVAGLAHEMNTPLGIMTTALSQLEDNTYKLTGQIQERKLSLARLEDYQSQSQQCFDLLGKNLTKSVALVQNFKSLSTVQPGEKAKSFYLSDAIDLAVNMHTADFASHDISLIVDMPKHITMVSFKDAITDIFTHLFQNTCIHAFSEYASNKKIFINISQCNKTIAIEYRDNGTGLSREDAIKVIEPFYTTKRNAKCIGLGIPIVYNYIIHTLGGDVVELCQQEPGFSLIFTLPVNVSNT